MTSVLDLDNLSPSDNTLFNQVAAGARLDFDALVALVSGDHVDDIDWIVGSVASRNKFQSPLFLRCCLLTFVVRKLATHVGALEIRVADRALAETLRRGLAARQADITIRCTETLSNRFSRITRPVRQWLIVTATFALRFVARRRPRSVKGPIVLLDTFVIHSTTGESGSIVDGIHKDRYYTGLLDQLKDEERAGVYFLPSILGFTNPIPAFRQIHGARTPFLLHDDYLGVRDYLFALTSPLRSLRRTLPDVEFAGFRVGAMLREDQRRHCADLNALLALLYYRFAMRLAEAGVEVRLLVEWYENQSIDRGMIVGFHRFHPRTRIVGYQGYIVATDLHIYIHPTRAEARSGAVPDVVAVTGPGLENAVREFLPELHVDVAPGFRFQKVWRERKLYPNPGTFTVLVSLPVEPSDGAHILDLLAGDARFTERGGLRIRIKPHPTFGVERVLALLPGGRLPDHWQVVSGDFHDVLETSDVLISNASSTCLESLAKGVPVIVIAPPTGIVQNVIPSSIASDMWAICSTSKDIAAAIDSFRRNAALQRQDLERRGREIRDAYFAPVTRASVERFMDLNGRR